jgi:hypothetical protein
VLSRRCSVGGAPPNEVLRPARRLGQRVRQGPRNGRTYDVIMILIMKRHGQFVRFSFMIMAPTRRTEPPGVGTAARERVETPASRSMSA